MTTKMSEDWNDSHLHTHGIYAQQYETRETNLKWCLSYPVLNVKKYNHHRRPHHHYLIIIILIIIIMNIVIIIISMSIAIIILIITIIIVINWSKLW